MIKQVTKHVFKHDMMMFYSMIVFIIAQCLALRIISLILISILLVRLLCREDLSKLCYSMDTFSSNYSSSVCEVLEEKGGRMVVEVDEGSEGNRAVESESDKPGQYYHYQY